jgi:hypothetical protein
VVYTRAESRIAIASPNIDPIPSEGLKRQIKVECYLFLPQYGAKATHGYEKISLEFFEPLVDPFFPLESVLIEKQMHIAAASRNAVIPKTYGRVHQSAASFSRRARIGFTRVAKH